MTVDDVEGDCHPVSTNHQLNPGTKSYNGHFDLYTEKPGDVAHPCGLVAKSFFNDTYALNKKEDQT